MTNFEATVQRLAGTDELTGDAILAFATALRAEWEQEQVWIDANERLRKQEPSCWFYKVNGYWDHYEKECPPDDAYDEGSLKLLYEAPMPAQGSWIDAESVNRLAGQLDVAMNGENAAKNPSLCDVISQACAAFKYAWDSVATTPAPATQVIRSDEGTCYYPNNAEPTPPQSDDAKDAALKLARAALEHMVINHPMAKHHKCIGEALAAIDALKGGK